MATDTNLDREKVASNAMLTNFWARGDDQPVERLLKLYSDRAGVKRELSDMRRERYELLDKLKEQESAISRAHEQLEGLELLLTDPLSAANAMVYFQLRHLWRVGTQKLEQFAADLRAQREERERARLHEDALAKRRRRLTAINEKLDSVLRKQQTLAENIGATQDSLNSLNGLFRIFKGPGLRRRLAGMKNGNDALQEKIDELKELGEGIRGETLPEPEGLSLRSRRLINCAVIAMAQYLVVHFSDHDLINLTKTATERSVADMKFGERGDCDEMVERIRERIDDLHQQKRLTDDVRRRTDYLVNCAKYADETNALPTPESIANTLKTIPKVEDEGMEAMSRTKDAPLKINVLEDEYWGLFSVLC